MNELNNELNVVVLIMDGDGLVHYVGVPDSNTVTVTPKGNTISVDPKLKDLRVITIAPPATVMEMDIGVPEQTPDSNLRVEAFRRRICVTIHGKTYCT